MVKRIPELNSGQWDARNMQNVFTIFDCKCSCHLVPYLFWNMFPFLNRIQHIYIIRNLTFFLCRPFSVLKTEETFTISRQLSARGEKFANGPGSVMIPSRVEWYFKFKTGVHTSHVAINCFKEQCFKKGKLSHARLTCVAKLTNILGLNF